MFGKFIIRLVLTTFFFTSIGPLPDVSAQTLIDLPAPGMMVNTSGSYQPLQLKGILVNIKNPLRFDFLIDKGDSGLHGQTLKDGIIRSAKYFLTCLTVPENDLWVNLSPYEKDRIVPGNFGVTLMGKDLLEQDYLLKQMMASLSYPKNDLGKRFWQKVYRKSYELYGTTAIPINTFNKVWIIPKSAQVYVQGNAAFVVNSQLDVMLEADYKAFVYHLGNKSLGINPQGLSQKTGAYSQVLRDVILPELRQEVNEGKNFAVVRQVYNAMILATWYKRHLKDSLLGRMYVGQNKVRGVDIADKHAKEKIFQQYLKAYNKCVYDYIKEDYDPYTQQTVPRKYASGGVNFTYLGIPGSTYFGNSGSVYEEVHDTKGMKIGNDLAMATVDVTATNSDGAMVSFPDMRAEINNTNPLHVVRMQNAAMISQKIRVLARSVLLSLVVMTAVGVSAPSLAAQLVPNADGKYMDVIPGKEDAKLGLGGILQQAGYTMPLWGQHGAVAGVLKFVPEIHNTKVYVGKRYKIPTQDELNRLISNSVSSGVLTSVSTAQAAPKAGLQSKATFLPAMPIAPVVSLSLPLAPLAPILTAKAGDHQVTLSSGSPPPPDQEEVWSEVKINLVFAVLFSLAGLKAKRLLSNLKRKTKMTASGAPLEPPQSSGISPSVLPLPIKESVLPDVVQPPPAASPGEVQILADDLAKLRAVANGEIAPPPPIPAEEDTQMAKSTGQNLWWMDAGALLGGIGLSLWLDGGISSLLVIYPLLTRGFYVGQKWLHEIFHLVPAAGLYPAENRAIWSGNNLKGNLSLGQWFKSLIPFTRTNRADVDLPFATAEGNWWNKVRNQMVAKSGLTGSVALALIAGYFMGATPLLAPLVLSALAVLKGSVDSGDLLGSEDTDEGRFGCGIIGFVKRVPLQGVRTKDLKSWLTWFFDGVESSTARGGQQAGVSTRFFSTNGDFVQLDEKITKEKRNWMFWKAWDNGPVFYRNMIDDLHSRLYKALPGKIVPVYNYAKTGVLKALGHVRFATNGDMVEEAAHPHSSAEEEREQWVYDAVRKSFRKVTRVFQITSAFNGDHDYTKIGIPYRQHLLESKLGNIEMRRFFSAAGHSYYEKRVTKFYLRKTVGDGNKYEQQVKTNYGAVLQALRKKGYVDFGGHVSHRFKGLDEEFKSWFPGYKKEVFAGIESALFGIPPGDAPIIPLEQHLLLTQGDWFASVRNAHIMANHRDLKEAMDDILFEKEGRAVGRVFSEVYDQVEPYISRRGYNPEDPGTVRSLNDLYVEDEGTAKSLGLENQYRMVGIFKDMLNKRMQEEALQQTLAGDVFRQWEHKWKRQGEDAGHMRRLIIDVAVEKFFTADNIAATKEFAERSEGSYGVFMSNSLDDSITLYQNNQDVVIGINQTTGDYGFASDPRSLKSLGPNGERFEEIMHLREGEIVNVSFSPSGKIVVRSWTRISGKWRESTKEDLSERFYPTSEYVDGQKNPYYAGPPVQYDNPRMVVEEDLRNTSRILANAQAELNDPNSFNLQSTNYLGKRIKDTIINKGRARFVLIGYDNSFELSKQFKEITKDLISDSRLAVDVIDANKFNESPSKFKIKPGDIVMIVSKSGATFSTKLSMRLIQALVDPEDIFCMTARIDSVLNTMLGQGLRPGDRFTKRIFIAGDFYPAETPVVSDVLLMFQLQQLAVNLARALEGMDGLNFSPIRLEQIAKRITEHSITMAQELTGFDINGKEYVNANKEIEGIGTYLGKIALETFIRNWFMNLFVFGVLEVPSALLLSQYIGGGVLGAILNVIWINYVVRFLATEFYRKIVGRPKYGVHAPFQLFIAATELIHKTQRNFFSRIMTNRFTSIGPLEPLGGDPKTDFTANYASAVKPGDVILRFFLAHRENEGRMGVNQTAYPQTEVFGPRIKGKAEIKNVVINVPMEDGATKEEISLMDNTVGFLGQMLAAKRIGVGMARVASWFGKLFNRAYSWSSAGVHTTQINPINDEANETLELGNRKIEARVDSAQAVSAGGGYDRSSLTSTHDPGGIDMNSRLMQLKITGDTPNRVGVYDNVMSISAIRGVVPKVSGIVTVTPEMLKAMLGAGYLN